MKTVNLVRRNIISRRIALLVFWSFCFFFVGCTTLDSFSRIEAEASKYGTVSVGAVRVIKYDNEELKASRKQLRKALCAKREKLLKDPNMVPQVYELDTASKYLGIMINLIKSRKESEQADSSSPPSPPIPQDPSTYFKELSQVFHSMMKTQPPRPSEIELIGLRLAAMKFIESEIEDVNLARVYPVDTKHYRRFVVSLDFAAWVRGEAKASLVYVDLYPYKADSWCHKAARIVEERLAEVEEKFAEDEKKFAKVKKQLKRVKEQKAREKKGKFKEAWTEADIKPEAFSPKLVKSVVAPEYRGGDLKDWVAYLHKWLAEKKLLPQIIHVERMGEGEYLILGEGSYSGLEFQLGGTHPTGVSVGLKGGAARKAEGVTAKVRPLSLAFIAGDRRAGWLFKPSESEDGRMPPTERRLRMVVDIPNHMSKLAIHVHKTFLGSDLGILSDANFANQMARLNLTKWKLNEVEQLYGGYEVKEPLVKGSCYASPRNWRLAKSRIRNLLYQGWSEEIVVDIPQE